MRNKKSFYNFKIGFISLLFSFLSFFAYAQQSKPLAMPTSPVTVEGDEVSYMPEKRMMVAAGNVKLQNKDVTIYCDKAQYSAISNFASLQGNIKIFRKNAVIYGDDIQYDFETSNTNMRNIRMISNPLYGRAKRARAQGKNKYLLREGYITSCDLEKPHYRITAKKITFFPGDKVVANNIIVKVGDLPVFYFPYLAMSLKDMSFPFEIIPGSKKEWGYYVLGRWRYHLNEENKGDFYLDWYEKRGFGKGIAHQFKSDELGEGTITYYNIHDQLYSLDKRDQLFDYYPDRRNENWKYLIDDRYKGQFAYYFKPTPDLSIRSEFHKFSDKYFMKDFFYREYDREPEPISYTFLDYNFYRSSFSLLGQKRVNHFFSQTEYLPQFEYDIYDQKIGKAPIYFRSKTVGGSLAKKIANSDNNNNAVRVYSDNLLSSPNRFKWLTITPYIGGYTAWYSQDKIEDESIYQGALHSGIDFNSRIFKVYNVNSYILGETITALRHVLTPNLKYEYIHPPVVPAANIAAFDELDNLERKERVVFSFENKLQARGINDNVWDFIYFSPSLEYVINNKTLGNHLDKAKLDIEFYPKPGIAMNAYSEYDCYQGELKSVNADMTFSEPKKNKYSVCIGQRYTSGESNQTTLEFTYKLSTKWEWRNYLRYENEGGKIQEQQYVIRRDLHCWWMDLGVNFDKDRNYTVWAAIYLKAFPDIHFNAEQTYQGGRSSY